MTEKLIPLQGCPLESCEAPVERALLTTEPTKLTMQNQVHERVCIAPGVHQEGVVIVYHGDLDPIEVEEPDPEIERLRRERERLEDEVLGEDEPDDAPSEPEDPEEPTEAEIEDAIDDIREGDGEHDEAVADAIEDAREEAGTPDPDELTGDLAVLYDKVVELEVRENSAILGTLKGQMLDADVAPSEVADLADKLVERGYLVEIEDAIYKTA